MFEDDFHVDYEATRTSVSTINTKKDLASKANIPLEEFLDVSPEYITVNVERYMTHRMPSYFDTQHPKGAFKKVSKDKDGNYGELVYDYEAYRADMRKRSPKLLELLDYIFEGLEDRMKVRATN